MVYFHSPKSLGLRAATGHPNGLAFVSVRHDEQALQLQVHLPSESTTGSTALADVFRPPTTLWLSPGLLLSYQHPEDHRKPVAFSVLFPNLRPSGPARQTPNCSSSICCQYCQFVSFKSHHSQITILNMPV